MSSPHSGTFFPEELRTRYLPSVIDNPMDTDWYINNLYDFAPSLGAIFICSNYSRFVADLNRQPMDEKLYDDGRPETGVVSRHSFSGIPLYIVGQESTPEEIKNRLNQWYHPYYAEIKSQLEKVRKKFGYAIFFDCHSIKRNVSTISDKPFPDLILGTQDGKTCHGDIAKAAIDTLQNSPYQLSVNAPFKGGFLTRNFGCPELDIHAIQLEMSQDLYMNEETTSYDREKAEKLRATLKLMIEKILQTAKELYA